MNRVLVTGAGGFVGRTLCPYLQERGFAVRQALRKAPKPADAVDAEGYTVVGEIGPDTDWRSALSGVDTVIHLAGRAHVLREQSRDPLEAFRRVNALATERLARQAAECGVRRFVFLSTIGVHGDGADRPIVETSPIRPEKPYTVSKWEAECVLREFAKVSELDVVIVRPPLMHGPWVRGNFLRLLHWVKRGYPLPLGGVRNRRSFLGVENLADFLAACVTAERCEPGVFVLCDGEHISTPDLLRALARLLERPCRLIPVPEVFLRGAGRLLGRGDDVARLTGSLMVDARLARQTLAWTPPVSHFEGLERMCAWYRREYMKDGT